MKKRVMCQFQILALFTLALRGFGVMAEDLPPFEHGEGTLSWEWSNFIMDYYTSDSGSIPESGSYSTHTHNINLKTSEYYLAMRAVGFYNTKFMAVTYFSDKEDNHLPFSIKSEQYVRNYVLPLRSTNDFITIGAGTPITHGFDTEVHYECKLINRGFANFGTYGDEWKIIWEIQDLRTRTHSQSKQVVGEFGEFDEIEACATLYKNTDFWFVYPRVFVYDGDQMLLTETPYQIVKNGPYPITMKLGSRPVGTYTYRLVTDFNDSEEFTFTVKKLPPEPEFKSVTCNSINDDDVYSAGEQGSVIVKFYNRGSYTAVRNYVDFYIDDVLFERRLIDDLAPNATRTEIFKFLPETFDYGKHTVKIVSDATNVIDEFDETNNICTKEFTVKEPAFFDLALKYKGISKSGSTYTVFYDLCNLTTNNFSGTYHIRIMDGETCLYDAEQYWFMGINSSSVFPECSSSFTMNGNAQSGKLRVIINPTGRFHELRSDNNTIELDYDFSGSSVGRWSECDVTPPATPSQMTSTVVDGNVLLEWETILDRIVEENDVSLVTQVYAVKYRVRYCLANDVYAMPTGDGEETIRCRYALSDLAPGVYYWQVAACDDSGNYSKWSLRKRFVVTGEDDLPAPATPTGVRASDGEFHDKVLIEWQPADAASSYEIYRNTTNVKPSTPIGLAAMDAFYEDKTAEMETPYYYWVKAVNREGDSDFSDSDTGYISDFSAPSAPTNVKATNEYYTDRIRVRWEPSRDAESYTVYRGTSEHGYERKWDVGNVTSFSDATAVPGISYHYRVVAKNYKGESPFSELSSEGKREVGITTSDVLKFAANETSKYAWIDYGGISGFNSSFTYDGTRDIWPSWISSIKMEYTLSSGGSTTVWLDRNNVNCSVPGGSVVTITVTVQANMTSQKRSFKLSNPLLGGSYGTSTSGFSHVSSVTTIEQEAGAPPSAPTISVLNDGASGGIVILLNEPSDENTYQIYRGEVNNSSSAKLIAENITTTMFMDVTAISGTTYYYWVKEVNSAGASDFSEPDSGYVDGDQTTATTTMNVTIPAAGGMVKSADIGNMTGDAYTFSISGHPSWIASATLMQPDNGNAFPINTSTFTHSWDGACYLQIEAQANTTWASRSWTMVIPYGENKVLHVVITQASTGPDPLAVPTNVKATNEYYTDRINVSWDPLQNAESYIVYRGTSEHGYEMKWDVGNVTSFSDTNAVPGISYYYRVVAKDHGVTGNFSALSTEGKRKVATSSSGVLKFAANETSKYAWIDYGIKGFNASFSYDGTLDTWPSWISSVEMKYMHSSGSSMLRTVRLNGNNVSCSVYGGSQVTITVTLQANTTSQKRSFKLSNPLLGGNYGTSGSGSYYVSTVTTIEQEAGAVPSAPTFSVSNGDYSDKIVVCLNETSEGNSYQIYRGESNNSASAKLIATNITTTAFTDITAASGTTYYYWAKEANGVGASGFSDCRAGCRGAVVTKPSAPTGVNATDGSYTDKVQVSWNLVDDADSYTVYRGTSSSSSSATVLKSGVTGSFYDDTSAVAGTTYYYWVQAVNDAGSSGFSEEGDTGYAALLTMGYAANAVSETYNGNARSITVSVSKPTSGYTILYSTSASGPWSTTKPTYTTVCSGVKTYFKITAAGYADVKGYQTVTIAAKTLTDLMVTLSTTSFVYDGTAKKPGILFTDANITSSDYSISYANNVNPGTATVTITGRGNYTGTVKKTFTITQTGNSWTTEPSMANWTYGDTASTPVAAAKYGICTITYNGSSVKPTNAGTYTATFSVPASDNYGALSRDVQFTILPRTLTSSMVSLSATSFLYDGAAKKPDVNVSDGGLITSDDYAISYENNVNPGTATVTITGKGNYTGSATKTFTIEESEPSIAWEYTIDNGEVTITGVSQDAVGAVEIPGMIEGYPVTKIGSYAFFLWDDLESSLESIVIPHGVTEIGPCAFLRCGNLKRVMIPSSVTTIGGGAFRGCNLEELQVDEGNLHYSSQDGVLFDKQRTTLIQCGTGVGADYVIPNDVTTIADGAFILTEIEDIRIPDNVTNLGESAFGSCYSLTNVVIGRGVNSIPNGAFSSCENLETVSFGPNVTNIGGAAFAYTGLRSVIIPDVVLSLGVESEGEGNAFAGCYICTSV